jgi:hypothetical protein
VKIKPWFFGNTTVRSPFRLREGLIVIKEANLEGQLTGKENELKFCRELHNHGVIEWSNTDSTFSVGRKWRSALDKLGFLWPRQYNDQSKHFSITPAGHRLINSESVAAWNECFLRALLAYQIPSIVNTRFEYKPFSPLTYIIKLLSILSEENGQGYLSPLEIGTIVQFSSPNDPLENTIERIYKIRGQYSRAKSKRKFEQSVREEASRLFQCAISTPHDYADLNIRYLKATGLFLAKGRGITLASSKQGVIEGILSNELISLSDQEFLEQLCLGAKLPFDDLPTAKSIIEKNAYLLKSKGGDINLSEVNWKDEADVSIMRHEIEDKLSRIYEKEYAENQRNEIDEIIAFLELLLRYPNSRSGLKKVLDTGKEITIPRGEGPAYFEWTIWRVFLAVDSLCNEPWEARRFKIDQDFLPIGTAPGRGSDIILEFNDLVLIVEVTLTSSSRQEAAEGEPVRRHIAQYAEEYSTHGKDVYGLFIAINIDTNTANTFRLGEWYTSDDSKIGLRIVPVQLENFCELIKAVKNTPEKLLLHLKTLLLECRAAANCDAPEWKKFICDKVSSTAKILSH